MDVLQLREFLQKSLYDPDQGYFTAAKVNAPVGSVGKALAFPQLAGEDGYRRAVREAYDNLEVRPCKRLVSMHSPMSKTPLYCPRQECWHLDLQIASTA